MVLIASGERCVALAKNPWLEGFNEPIALWNVEFAPPPDFAHWEVIGRKLSLCIKQFKKRNLMG